jgi:[lysine-biosynthesis-protein LysW]--L-2-aminoadipate ligase
VNLGFLYDRIRPDEKALIKCAREKGIDVELIDCKRAILDVSSFIKPSFNTALQRCVSFTRCYHSTIVLETLGIKVVNSSKVIFTCGNKLLTSLALAKRGIPTPKTKVAFTIESALNALEELGYPAILKPVIGSWGRLVTLLKDRDSAKSILESWDQLGGAWYKIYYLQEYVATEPLRDIRCVVIGDNVVAAIYRYAPKGDWRTNLAVGGKAEKCEITDELEDICLKTAEAIDEGVLGIDLMESNNGLVVHEVNHNLEFRRTVPIAGVDIPSLIIEYVTSLAKK